MKGRILEDVWLGVEINRHGGRQLAVDLSPAVSCHMYRGIGAMWEGFVKWMYSVAAMSRAALVGMMIAGYVFFLAPFYWLWNELVVMPAATGLRPFIFFQVALIIAMRWLVDRRFKEPVISALLHPLGFSFVFLASVYAGVRQMVGKGVCWKDRLYGRESGVE